MAGKKDDVKPVEEPQGDGAAANPNQVVSELSTYRSKPKLCCSMRLGITCLMFMAMWNYSLSRFSIAFAIVCMTPPHNSSKEAALDCGPILAFAQMPSHKAHFTNLSGSMHGALISGEFVGFLLGPTISGFLTYRFGGRVVLFASASLSALTYLVTPVMAQAGPWPFFIARIFTGLFGSLTLPAVYGTMSYWAVPEERQLLMGAAYCGIPLFVIVAFPISGFTCAYLGWEWLFYFAGIWMIICAITYALLVRNHPGDCTGISLAEATYLKEKAPPRNPHLPIPWRHIVKSVPIYVYFLMHFFMSFNYLGMVINLPRYLRDVHHVDTKSDGILSAVPSCGTLLMRVLIAIYADRLRHKLNFTKTMQRKTSMVIGAVGASTLLLIISFMTCKVRAFVVVVFLFYFMLVEFTMAGAYAYSLLDLTPSYANLLTGMANSFSNIAGVINPMVINALVGVHGNQTEWGYVMYMVICVYLIAMVIYVTLGYSEQLPWGKIAR